MGKMHQLPHFPSLTKYNSPLELVFSDLWSLGPITASLGYRFYICSVDAFSIYTCIYLLHNKSQAFQAFQQYKAYIELQSSHKIKALQTNNGKEYLSNFFVQFLQHHGIAHGLTCPNSHQQNGYVERKHRSIIETGLTLLANASLPLKFWDHAFMAATYVINKLPSLNTRNQSLYQLLFNKPPDYKFLKIFGCASYPNLRPYTQHKLNIRTHQCTFLSYAP